MAINAENSLSGISKAIEKSFLYITSDYEGKKYVTLATNRLDFNFYRTPPAQQKTDYENFIIPIGTETTDLRQTLITANNVIAKRYDLPTITDVPLSQKDIDSLDTYLKKNYLLLFEKGKHGEIICRFNFYDNLPLLSYDVCGYNIKDAVTKLLEVTSYFDAVC